MKEIYAVINTENNIPELVSSFKNFDDAAKRMCEEVISHFEDADEEIDLTADEIYNNAINANGCNIIDDDNNLYYCIDVNLHNAHAQTDIHCEDYDIDVIKIPIPEGE